jgi:hypothetical protein
MVSRALAEGLLSRKQAQTLCPQLGYASTDFETTGSQVAALRAMPPDQRDARLAKVAEEMAAYYASDPELTAFEAFDEDGEGGCA